MKRSAPLSRRTPLRRGTACRPYNTARKRRNWQRAYGSKERVEWVKSRPCLVCQKLPSENAHTETGGMGRKADASTIVPLCHYHHTELHHYGRETFERSHFINLSEWAGIVDRRWQHLQDR